MSFLRDIWSDLVEKRLWPVAVLLVMAMIAAPVVLAGGSDPAAPAPPAATTPEPESPKASAAIAGAPVRLDQAPAQPAPKGGYKDPFAGAAKAAVAQSSTPPPSTGGPTATQKPNPDPAPSGGDVVTSPGPSVEPAVPDTTPVDPPTTTPAESQPSGVFAGYRVDVHWGRAGNAKRTQDVTRIGVLDAGDDPLLVYLGVRRGGERALFMLVRDAGAVGDGRCMPVEDACQVVEMRAGESQFFDVEGAGGSIEQYELDVDRIVKRYADTGAEARELRVETSKRGRKVLTEALKGGRDYADSFDYLRDDGVIVRDVDATKAWYSQASYAEVGADSGE